MDTSEPSASQPSDDPFAQLTQWGQAVQRRTLREQRLRRLQRGFRRAVVGLIVLLLVGGGVLAVKGVLSGRPGRAAARPQSYPTDAVPTGVSATSSPSPAPSASATGDGPFAGTPAASFPVGAAGITLPPAKATGAWTAGQVAADLAHVKAALIASHLDHRMLVGHDPSTFLALLASHNRTAIAKDIQAGGAGITAVRIAPSAHLASDPPRVSGRTTYRATTVDHVSALEVITNYVGLSVRGTGLLARLTPGDRPQRRALDLPEIQPGGAEQPRHEPRPVRRLLGHDGLRRQE